MINKIEERQFDMAVASGKVIVMLSFEDKCKSCEEMKPLFEKFATENPEIKCHQINYKFSLPAKPEGELISKFNITTFPTFLSFENGKMITKMQGSLAEKTLKLPFLSVLELKGMAYDAIEHIESVELIKQDLVTLNALIGFKSQPQTEAVQVKKNSLT